MPDEVKLLPWPLFGYAPGNYSIICYLCKAEVDDCDKRAISCLPCAVVQAKTHIAAIEATRPTEQVVGWQPRLMSDEAKSGATVLVYFTHHGWLTVEWNNRFLDISEPVTLENGIWCVNDHKNDVWHVRGYSDGDDTHWMPLPDAPAQGTSHD